MKKKEKKKRFKIEIKRGQMSLQTIWDYIAWGKPIEIILEEK